MQPYLLSGSFAYDTILLHEGELQHSILPESLSRLNVSFGIDDVQNQFGGTGGNIGYNAALLGQRPLLIGTLGSKDSDSYLRHLSKSGSDGSSLTIIENALCAHAWILTDKKNNQITSFSGGSMKHMPSVPEDTPEIWHLSPENPMTMAALAVEAIKNNKKYFFDPGQVLPYFLQGASKSILSLEEIIKNATGLFVNEYENELLCNYLGSKTRVHCNHVRWKRIAVNY
jgi:adenosine kinase